MAIIEMGTISSRGQVAIPSNIREHLGLKEGTKVLFAVQDKTLVMKTVESMNWDEITSPLISEMKRTALKESDAADIVHKMRRKKKNEGSS